MHSELLSSIGSGIHPVTSIETVEAAGSSFIPSVFCPIAKINHCIRGKLHQWDIHTVAGWGHV